MKRPNVLAFAGSARSQSLNKQLIQYVATQLSDLDLNVTFKDLSDFQMPLYDGDLEEASGIPEAAVRFYDLLCSHDGFAIACPEYNSSITPLLKNTIDWATRPRSGESPLKAFTGKSALLCAASPGALGGVRGLNHVSSILQSIGTLVVPIPVSVPSAHQVISASGIGDERVAGMLNKLCARFANVLRGAQSMT